MSPNPADISQARQCAGHTAEKAVEVIDYARSKTWYEWESGKRNMPQCAYDLYLLRTGQHPTHVIKERKNER